MSDKVSYNRTAFAFSILLYGMSDVTDGVTRFYHGHTFFEALSGHLDNFSGFGARRSNKKSFAGVGIVSIQNRSDIDVDDITICQLVISRDAMTDNIVDRDADTLRETPVVQGRWYGVVLDSEVMYECIDVVCLQSGFDDGFCKVEGFYYQFPGLAESLDVRLFFEMDLVFPFIERIQAFPGCGILADAAALVFQAAAAGAMVVSADFVEFLFH